MYYSRACMFACTYSALRCFDCIGKLVMSPTIPPHSECTFPRWVSISLTCLSVILCFRCPPSVGQALAGIGPCCQSLRVLCVFNLFIVDCYKQVAEFPCVRMRVRLSSATRHEQRPFSPASGQHLAPLSVLSDGRA